MSSSDISFPLKRKMVATVTQKSKECLLLTDCRNLGDMREDFVISGIHSIGLALPPGLSGSLEILILYGQHSGP